MKRLTYLIGMIFLMTGATPLWASEDPDLIKRLGEAKLSLLDGIKQVEYEQGPTISGKFEMKKGILKLSLYTVEDGMAVGAEKNALLEHIGDATKKDWSPNRVEFTDKPHIARASVQLTLLQLSRYSFKDVIRLVGKKHGGMIYSVKPKLIKGKALVEVKVLNTKTESKTVMFDLATGSISSDRCR